MRELSARKVRLVEVETPQPSPFARSLLFGYVGAFLYGGDVPLAERRAAALALDSTLLGELLGRVELRELLDPEVVAETGRRLQWLGDTRTARDAEDVAEMLRMLGDLTEAECVARGARAEWLAELGAARRAIEIRIAGEARWIAIEDAGRVSDALGVALPVGVPTAYLEAVPDPLADLLARFARTRAPFTTAECAARFGLGSFVVEQALKRLGAGGRVVAGEFTPGAAGGEWCDAEVLRLLRRRSLAALRREIEPVPPATLARFLPGWQHVASQQRGVDAVAAVIEQLQGVPVPASAWERLVLPARVADYSPAYLDELCASGEVMWAGCGDIGGAGGPAGLATDGWITFAWADAAPLLLPPATEELARTPLHDAVLAALTGGQAMFFRALADAVGGADDELLAALWDLVWAGMVANDTLAPVRALLGSGGTHRARPSASRSRYRRPGAPGRARPSLTGGTPLAVARGGLPAAAGRWYGLPARDLDPTRRAAALADALLERHGVLTRGAVTAEGPPGGFAGVYPVLAAMEERGAARRGYFVEGLGAAQFAVAGAVDRLRALTDTAERRGPEPPEALVLAATDPANPYGAALPWPDRPVEEGETGGGHRPGRRAGALVVTVAGELALYVERGGRTILSYVDTEAALGASARALAGAVRSGALGAMSVERADGETIRSTPLADALAAAGFRATPRGLRLRA
jgi:ATP-dependent Lhr-like helicase